MGYWHFAILVLASLMFIPGSVSALSIDGDFHAFGIGQDIVLGSAEFEVEIVGGFELIESTQIGPPIAGLHTDPEFTHVAAERGTVQARGAEAILVRGSTVVVELDLDGINFPSFTGMPNYALVNGWQFSDQPLPFGATGTLSRPHMIAGTAVVWNSTIHSDQTWETGYSSATPGTRTATVAVLQQSSMVVDLGTPVFAGLDELELIGTGHIELPLELALADGTRVLDGDIHLKFSSTESGVIVELVPQESPAIAPWLLFILIPLGFIPYPLLFKLNRAFYPEAAYALRFLRFVSWLPAKTRREAALGALESGRPAAAIRLLERLDGTPKSMDLGTLVLRVEAHRDSGSSRLMAAIRDARDAGASTAELELRSQGSDHFYII